MVGGFQRTFNVPKIQRKGDRQSERTPAELTKELLSSISRALGAREGCSHLPRGTALLSRPVWTPGNSPWEAGKVLGYNRGQAYTSA